MPLLEYARASRDPNVKMVLFEDTVALIGLGLAGIGIGLNQLTGSHIFDPAASILIGLLLVGVAFWLGHDAKHLLVGASARPAEREQLERVAEQFDEVDRVDELLTMVLGPNALLVAARVDLHDGVDSAHVEQVSTDIDRKMRETVPDVTEVFIDPTPSRSRSA
jgi:cation diffusion facilitator family transporter